MALAEALFRAEARACRRAPGDVAICTLGESRATESRNQNVGAWPLDSTSGTPLKTPALSSFDERIGTGERNTETRCSNWVVSRRNQPEWVDVGIGQISRKWRRAAPHTAALGA
jgi:hypothetical protein